MSEVAATLKYARASAQKVRLVTDLIRSKNVTAAMDVLDFCNKSAALLVKKVLASAIANAEHNEGADIDELTVSEVYVNEGPRLSA